MNCKHWYFPSIPVSSSNNEEDPETKPGSSFSSDLDAVIEDPTNTQTEGDSQSRELSVGVTVDRQKGLIPTDVDSQSFEVDSEPNKTKEDESLYKDILDSPEVDSKAEEKGHSEDEGVNKPTKDVGDSVHSHDSCADLLNNEGQLSTNKEDHNDADTEIGEGPKEGNDSKVGDFEGGSCMEDSEKMVVECDENAVSKEGDMVKSSDNKEEYQSSQGDGTALEHEECDIAEISSEIDKSKSIIDVNNGKNADEEADLDMKTDEKVNKICKNDSDKAKVVSEIDKAEKGAGASSEKSKDHKANLEVKKEEDVSKIETDETQIVSEIDKSELGFIVSSEINKKEGRNDSEEAEIVAKRDKCEKGVGIGSEHITHEETAHEIKKTEDVGKSDFESTCVVDSVDEQTHETDLDSSIIESDHQKGEENGEDRAAEEKVEEGVVEEQTDEKEEIKVEIPKETKEDQSEKKMEIADEIKISEKSDSEVKTDNASEQVKSGLKSDDIKSDSSIVTPPENGDAKLDNEKISSSKINEVIDNSKLDKDSLEINEKKEEVKLDSEQVKKSENSDHCKMEIPNGEPKEKVQLKENNEIKVEKMPDSKDVEMKQETSETKTEKAGEDRTSNKRTLSRSASEEDSEAKRTRLGLTDVIGLLGDRIGIAPGEVKEGEAPESGSDEGPASSETSGEKSETSSTTTSEEDGDKTITLTTKVRGNFVLVSFLILSFIQQAYDNNLCRTL